MKRAYCQHISTSMSCQVMARIDGWGANYSPATGIFLSLIIRPLHVASQDQTVGTPRQPFIR